MSRGCKTNRTMLHGTACVKRQITIGLPAFAIIDPHLLYVLPICNQLSWDLLWLTPARQSEYSILKFRDLLVEEHCGSRKTHSMTQATPQEIGATVKRLRDGMTQAALAEVIGVDASTMCRIEAGERPLNLRELVLVAAELGVQPDSILTSDRQVFALRATADDPATDAALDTCAGLIEDYLASRAAAGSQ